MEQLAAQRTDRDALIQSITEAGGVVRGNNVRCPFHDDRTPSGSLYRDDSGVWRFRCHTAACGFTGDVFDVQAKASGRDVAEVLKEQNPERRYTSTTPKEPTYYPSLVALQKAFDAQMEACYIYTNPDTRRADLVVLRLRRDGRKTFLQARPHGDGFEMGAPAKPWPLYNRYRLRDAQSVVVAEGEQCIHALANIGIVATTSPCGAGKAQYADWTPLAGKTVVLWPDNDEPGRKHMSEVQQILSTLDPPCIVSVYPNQHEREHYDAADMIAEMTGLDPAEQREVINTTLDEAAMPTGASAELLSLFEDTISGRRKVVPWPWPVLTSLTRATLPGMLTLLCGDPGSRKTFFLSQTLMSFHEAGYRFAVFMLEHDRAYHLNRILAQRTGRGELFNPEWIQHNPDRARECFEQHREFLDSFGRNLWTADDSAADVTHETLTAWAEARAKAGCRIIAIDPVTAAEATRDPWIADHRFVKEMKRIARVYATSIILVTHPRINHKGGATLQDLAGGAAYPRFSQTVVWLESHEEPKTGPVWHEVPMFGTAEPRGVVEELSYDISIKLGKTTNGRGGGKRLAFRFTQGLVFEEMGIITTAKERG